MMTMHFENLDACENYFKENVYTTEMYTDYIVNNMDDLDSLVKTSRARGIADEVTGDYIEFLAFRCYYDEWIKQNHNNIVIGGMQ